MAEEIGRSFTWFLEDRGEARYRRHRLAVMEEAKHLAWRALIGVVVDVRDYPEAKQFPHLFKGFHTSFPAAPKQAWWSHYLEVMGKGQWLSLTDAGYHLTLQCDEQLEPLVIPLKAIVSDRSTGFPKVAYNVEQFILGYQTWLEAFRSYVVEPRHGQALIHRLHAYLIPENYPLPIYEHLLGLVQLVKTNIAIASSSIDALENNMIEDMEIRIPQQCKGMYHHALEWFIQPDLLKPTNRLIQAYFALRRQYPNMVPGKAFIPIKSIPPKR